MYVFLLSVFADGGGFFSSGGWLILFLIIISIVGIIFLYYFCQSELAFKEQLEENGQRGTGPDLWTKDFKISLDGDEPFSIPRPVLQTVHRQQQPPTSVRPRAESSPERELVQRLDFKISSDEDESFSIPRPGLLLTSHHYHKPLASVRPRAGSSPARELVKRLEGGGFTSAGRVSASTSSHRESWATDGEYYPEDGDNNAPAMSIDDYVTAGEGDEETRSETE